MSDQPSLTAATTEQESSPETTLYQDTQTSTAAEPAADEGGTPASPDAAAVEAGEQSTSIDSYADFSLPEGMQMDDATLSEVLPIFKEKGFTQEQAQAAVELYAAKVQAREQEQVAAFSKLMDDWRTQSANDKEFGGARFDESIKTARSALDKFGTPELKTLLEEHGVGNHPEVIRFMVKVGQLTREDSPGASGGPIGEQRDRASILYGTN